MSIRFILFFAFCLICISSVRIQAQNRTIYFYNEDSVMLAMPDVKLKEDSLVKYSTRIDSILGTIRTSYTMAKHKQDSIHLAHGGCPAQYCHHVSDSTETELQFRELAQEEMRLIDSILTEHIRDTIRLYAAQLARSKKYKRVMEEKQMTVLPIEGADNQTLSITQELIAYMSKQRR